VEQNVHQALKLADYAYVMENGAITLFGSSSELMKNPKVVDAYLGGITQLVGNFLTPMVGF
jgi:branched-chain amino acid transport system ATP-binding protein